MSNTTKKIVGVGLFTAIVVVLQVLAIVIRPMVVFNISLVLVPIVVGAAMYGVRGIIITMVLCQTDRELPAYRQNLNMPHYLKGGTR